MATAMRRLLTPHDRDRLGSCRVLELDILADRPGGYGAVEVQRSPVQFELHPVSSSAIFANLRSARAAHAA